MHILCSAPGVLYKSSHSAFFPHTNMKEGCHTRKHTGSLLSVSCQQFRRMFCTEKGQQLYPGQCKFNLIVIWEGTVFFGDNIFNVVNQHSILPAEFHCQALWHPGCDLYSLGLVQT